MGFSVMDKQSAGFCVMDRQTDENIRDERNARAAEDAVGRTERPVPNKFAAGSQDFHFTPIK